MLTICTEIWVKIFRQIVQVWYFFAHRKQEWDCVVPFTIFGGSVALIIQTDGSGNFGRFDESGKKGNTSKVLPFPRKHLNCPWNYRIYRTNCKRSRTTLRGRRSVAPGKFPLKRPKKSCSVYFFQPYFPDTFC